MAGLITNPPFMPRVIENFLAKINDIKFQLDQSLIDTSPSQVITSYEVCGAALSELDSIELQHPLATLVPYLNSYTRVADWTIFQSEYNILTKIDLPDYLLTIENNTSSFGVDSFSDNNINFQAFSAAEITTLQSKITQALSNYA